MNSDLFYLFERVPDCKWKDLVHLCSPPQNELSYAVRRDIDELFDTDMQDSFELFELLRYTMRLSECIGKFFNLSV